MTTVEKDVYRHVPYRFLIHDTKSNICKLEKLTSLFPELKSIIELEVFKINNLSQTIERLSQVFPIVNVVDNRDDTLHLFLGPYHLALGPAIFGALHFRNLSAALLASSKAKQKADGTPYSRNRRREAVLRRFRRAVRKLIFIKSIINQIHTASILTPYNQNELYIQGTYDVTLAGRLCQPNSLHEKHHSHESLHDIDSLTHSEKESSLNASKYIKINSLLNLLSTNTPSNNPDNNLPRDNFTQTMQDTGNKFSNTDDHSKSLIPTTTLCCSQHTKNQQNLTFAISRLNNIPPTQFLANEFQSKNNSNHSSRKNSSGFLSRKSTISLPDLSGDVKSPAEPSKSEMGSSTDLATNHPDVSNPQPVTSHEEDSLVDRVSTLLLDYLSLQQSTSTLSNSNMELSVTTKSTSDDSRPFNQSSTMTNVNQFDNLLERIRVAVNKSLSMKEQKNDPKPELNRTLQIVSSDKGSTRLKNLRRQYFASRTSSLKETTIEEFDPENPETPTGKHKLEFLNKSKSFDESNFILSSSEPTDSND